MPGLTDAFVIAVEAGGGDIGVTLVVDGVVVTGSITPSLRWHRWARECLNRSELHRDGFAIPPKAPSITMEQRLEMAETFRSEVPNPEEFEYVEFSLADAAIHAGPLPEHWLHFAFLRVAAARVSAITLGIARGHA